MACRYGHVKFGFTYPDRYAASVTGCYRSQGAVIIHFSSHSHDGPCRGRPRLFVPSPTAAQTLLSLSYRLRYPPKPRKADLLIVTFNTGHVCLPRLEAEGFVEPLSGIRVHHNHPQSHRVGNAETPSDELLSYTLSFVGRVYRQASDLPKFREVCDAPGGPKPLVCGSPSRGVVRRHPPRFQRLYGSCVSGVVILGTSSRVFWFVSWLAVAWVLTDRLARP